jgi:hypothetical protein
MPRCRVAAGALDRVTTRPALSEDETSLDARALDRHHAPRHHDDRAQQGPSPPDTGGVRCGRATFSGQYLSTLQGH